MKAEGKRLRTFVDTQNVINILKVAIAKICSSQCTFEGKTM